MYTFKCVECSNEFTHKRKNRKFCSQKCCTNHRVVNGFPHPELLRGECKDCKAKITKTRARCKDCYQKFLDKPRKRYKMTSELHCRDCGIEKTLENTLSPEPGLWATKCRKCIRKISNKSESTIKQQCIDYKGGCCQVCGYKKYIGALDFHHLNPDEKDFNIASRRGHKFNEKTKLELDKCALICSNCHREEHGRLAAGEPSLLSNTTGTTT